MTALPDHPDREGGTPPPSCAADTTPSPARTLQVHATQLVLRRLERASLEQLPPDSRAATEELAHGLAHRLLEPVLQRLRDDPDVAAPLLELFGLTAPSTHRPDGHAHPQHRSAPTGSRQP